MKSKLTKLDKRFAVVLFLVIFSLSARLVLPGFGQTTAAAPWITIQPLSKTVDYGADASFSVTAGDTSSVSYQWQKNGENLVDLENIAGSQSSTLNLVGVAANDEGNYSVVLSNGSRGSVTSSVAVLSINPTILFSDDFERGAGNWLPLVDANSLTNSSMLNHSAGGAWSLAMNNSSQKVFHNLPVQYACRMDYSFWFYDDGQSQISCGGELRGYTGPGYAKYISPGGLRQLIAIGRFNNVFPTNGSGDFHGAALDPTKYQARVLHGTNSGWFNLDASRSPGWHKFRIDRSGSAASGGKVFFYVDDVLARTVSGVSMSAVDSIFLGSFNGNKTEGTNQVSGNAFFDDVVVKAYPGLFDWQSLATDSPIPDWMQLRETGTNWQARNLAPLDVLVVNGSATNGGSGDWKVDGSAVYSTGLRGLLDYTVTTTADDAYRIRVEGRERDYRTPVVDLPVEVFIDGEYLGKHNLSYSDRVDGTLDCFTPFIRAGLHTIRLHWNNDDAYRSLLIKAVRLQTLTSSSYTGGGLKGWVAHRLVAQSGMEICPTTSLVSPVCVEGRGQFLNLMTVFTVGNGQRARVPVEHGAGNRWYANVPLSVSNATMILSSYQNGGLIQTNEILWQAVNLLAGTTNMTIRKGDSLLLTAVPEGIADGEVHLQVGKTNQFTTDASAPLPYQFDQPGIFTVTGTYVPGGTSGTMSITVVEASFEDSPIARVFHARYWNCTNLPPGVVLEADPRLKLVEVTDKERSQQAPALAAATRNEREFRVYTRAAEARYILARLGTNGPVLANTAVRGFRWAIAPETYLRVLDTNPDGSQLIETAFVASPVFPSFSVVVQIISSGVTFDDGTVTKNMSSQDFDITGTGRLRFIRSATAKGSTCHTTKLYDNEVLIGWR